MLVARHVSQTSCRPVDKPKSMCFSHVVTTQKDLTLGKEKPETSKPHSAVRTEDEGGLEDLLFLQGVDQESVRLLVEEICLVREVNQGTILIRSGQPNQFLYLLLSGRLRVHLELERDPVAVVRAGEVVGELSLIDGQLTSAYVVADTECRLLILDEETMWSLVDVSPAARNLLYLLAGRLREADAAILSSEQVVQEHERTAFTDRQTGLYNRRWLEAVLAWQFIRRKDRKESLSLLVIGIDDLDSYRQIYGSSASGQAVHTVGQTLRTCVRRGELVARYNEDEFILLLPRADAATGERVGERLRQATSAAKIVDSDDSSLPSVTVSVGVAEMKPEDTLESFIGAAQQAFGSARQSGGDRVFRIDRLQ